MQNQVERRSGADRRYASQIASGSEWLWYGTSLGAEAGDSYDPDDPYDPYWEPVNGQDDD